MSVMECAAVRRRDCERMLHMMNTAVVCGRQTPERMDQQLTQFVSRSPQYKRALLNGARDLAHDIQQAAAECELIAVGYLRHFINPEENENADEPDARV